MRSVICGPPPCTTTGFMPDEPHEHDVLREQVGERGVVHGVAAVLDDDGRPRELADVRQRLGEDSLPCVAAISARRRCSHDVPMFSSM